MPVIFQQLIAAHRFIKSEATTGRNSTFFEALASNKELGASRGIDAALKINHLDALVLPACGLTTRPAGMTVIVGCNSVSKLTVMFYSYRRISNRHR